MNPAERLGIEGLILSSRDRALGNTKTLRLAVEVAIPILLAVIYVAILFLSAEP